MEEEKKPSATPVSANTAPTNATSSSNATLAPQVKNIDHIKKDLKDPKKSL